jgi:glyoxylate/hydroxypyruvate reductase A
MSRTGRPTILLDIPPAWGQWGEPLAALLPDVNIIVNGQGPYAPQAIDYLVTLRPEPGLARSLPNVKVVFSVGAGVDAILSDPDYPRDVPLVRFVGQTLSGQMAQYIVMHVLIHHRGQRYFDAAQAMNKWRHRRVLRRTEHTRVGILGMGAMGMTAAASLRELEFPVMGWSRTRKHVPGVESFAGAGEFAPFLARSDVLVCLLPLTHETRGILNAKTFSLLPKGAFVINAARGAHLIEEDLVAAIDTGHLAGATLDVFQTEPLPETSALWNHPKVTITPHIAAMTDPEEAASAVAAGIAAHRRGDTLENVVDLSRGY